MTNVIVIDDDPTNAGLIKMILELDGFQVASCANMDEAKTAASLDTSAFIIDCNLARGASGIDILRAIRSGDTDAHDDTIVIMTSGDHRLEQEAIDSKADKFLLKPYSPDVLSTTLKNMLAEEDK